MVDHLELTDRTKFAVLPGPILETVMKNYNVLPKLFLEVKKMMHL